MTAATKVNPKEPEDIMMPSNNEHSSNAHHVLFRVEGKAGVITLNRPKALNALDLDMIRQIYRQLIQWRTDPSVGFILVEGAGERSFCAGGDIRSVYEARLRDDWDYMDHIFREEYQMNYLIGTYPKPYISFIHGICMGGGMGLSIHGSHRLITDNTIMAMPEAGIGFFTDIGASHFLNHCPGQVGICMGITGEKLTAADCLYAGLGTHYVPQDQWDLVKKSLLKAGGGVDALKIIQSLNHVPHKQVDGEGIEANQSLIDDVFTATTMEEIVENLEKIHTPKAHAWLKKIDTQSPTSMKIILALLHKTKGKSLKTCLTTEFRVGQHFMGNYDFFEGVRALLIDKDNKPHWQPRRLSDVLVKDVKRYFASLPEKELVFD